VALYLHPPRRLHGVVLSQAQAQLYLYLSFDVTQNSYEILTEFFHRYDYRHLTNSVEIVSMRQEPTFKTRTVSVTSALLAPNAADGKCIITSPDVTNRVHSPHTLMV
jgi:hypothetical protein